MTPVIPGRTAALAALLVVAVTACGTQRPQATAAASPPPSAPPSPAGTWPACAVPDGPVTVPDDVPPSPAATAPSARGDAAGAAGDGAPHYAENHAYRLRGEMSPGNRARTEASAVLVRRELERVRGEGGSGAYGVFPDARVVAALGRLGCGEEHGVHVGQGWYAVHTGTGCVTGRVTKDELTVSVHGAYAGPQPGAGPCVENRGGH